MLVSARKLPQVQNRRDAKRKQSEWKEPTLCGGTGIEPCISDVSGGAIAESLLISRLVATNRGVDGRSPERRYPRPIRLLNQLRSQLNRTRHLGTRSLERSYVCSEAIRSLSTMAGHLGVSELQKSRGVVVEDVSLLFRREERHLLD